MHYHDFLPSLFFPFAETSLQRAVGNSRWPTWRGNQSVTPTQVDSSRAPNQIVFRSTGDLPTKAELQDLRNAGALTAATAALIDLREATHMPTHEVIAEGLGKAVTDQHWPLRRAYLVRDGCQYGIARQMQAYAPEGMEVQVFIEEQRALLWLAARRADPIGNVLTAS